MLVATGYKKVEGLVADCGEEKAVIKLLEYLT